MKLKKFWIVSIIFIIGFSAIILFINIQIPKEREMKHYRFKDLEITSSKLPFNAHLRWETNSSGTIYLVDSLSQDTLCKSIDKCNTFDTDNGVFTSGTYQRTRKIQAGWHDRTNQKIYFVSCNQTDTQFTCWYIDLTDDSVTEMGTYAGTTVSAFDIAYSTTDTCFYVLGAEDDAGTVKFGMYKWVDPNWIQRDLESAFDSISYMIPDITYAGGTYMTCLAKVTGGNTHLFAWVDVTPAFWDIENLGANTDLPTSWNLKGISYDNSDLLSFVIKDTGDGNKSKIWHYKISTDTATKGLEYNISLMLDRDCSGVDPTPQEKAFGLTGTANNLKVYEIIPRGDRPMQIQDLSTIPSTTGRHIIAITDYFLMLDSGLMFEYTNVNYMNDCRIYDGIIPYKKRFTFTAHPTHYTYWNIGDMIIIYDDTPTLLFAGWIKSKPQKVNDKFECPGLANEIFERTYNKSFSSDTTKEKLQDIIANALKFCSEGDIDPGI